jgi:hypothetical protein
MTAEWTMDYVGPKVLLPVAHKGNPIGDVEVTFTDAGHAHVRAYSDPDPVPYRRGSVAYKGGHWYLSVNVYAEHGWDESPGNRYSRHQFTDHDSDKVIAPTYRAAIMAAITAAVSAFAAEHPEALTAAARNKLEHELADKLASERAALKDLEAARAEISRIKSALSALEEGKS